MKKSALTLMLAILAGSTAPSAAAAPAAAAFTCPVKHPVPMAAITDIPEVIDTELDRRFQAVMDDIERQKTTKAKRDKAMPVDPVLMTSLAQSTGCGALIDKEESCSRYFSPHVGSPIAIFMDMKNSDPVRQQFEKAISALLDKHEREAAQYCIKLTGKK